MLYLLFLYEFQNNFFLGYLTISIITLLLQNQLLKSFVQLNLMSLFRTIETGSNRKTASQLSVEFWIHPLLYY